MDQFGLNIGGLGFQTVVTNIVVAVAVALAVVTKLIFGPDGVQKYKLTSDLVWGQRLKNCYGNLLSFNNFSLLSRKSY